MSEKRKRAPTGCYWRNGILWGRLTVRGTAIKWSLRTSDVGVASRRRQARRALELNAAHFGEIRRSYDQAFAGWAARIRDQVAPDTVRRYAVSLKQLEADLRPLYLDQINNALVSQIVTRRRLVASIATVRRDLTALSSVLDFAETEGWHEGNAALAWLKRLRERRDPIVLPDPAHLERVIKRAPGALGAMLRAFRATGCRLTELAYARRSALDHGRRQLTVTGKGNKTRAIDLDPFGAYEILAAQPAYLAEPWIFWHGQGEPYRNLSSRFSAIVEAEHQAAIAAAGPGHTPDFRPFRVHDIRHLHAVEYLQSGRSIYSLQQRLGHSSIKTTEIYLDYLTAEQQLAVKFGASGAMELTA